MLAYYSFQRKSVKWRKKVFFYLFNQSVVNAHTVHNKKKRKNTPLELYKMDAEGLLHEAGKEIQEQSRVFPQADLLEQNVFHAEFW
jgi:hypothetical protein